MSTLPPRQKRGAVAPPVGLDDMPGGAYQITTWRAPERTIG